MNQSSKLFRYQLRNVSRAKAVIGYGVLLTLIAWSLVHFGGSTSRAILSLGNVVLIVVPLVALVFGTVHFYESREFDELVLAHPVHRRQLYSGRYFGLIVPMSLAYAVAVLIPMGAAGIESESLGAVFTLLVAGILLNAAFVAIAYLIATRISDPMKGLGTALATWLFFGVLYDGLVLLAATGLSAYPLERPMLALMMLNPVDLARILLLMELDVAALMGYTGAVFKSFFGGPAGPILSIGTLGLWILGPFWTGMRAFDRRDL
ncbi:MAG: ABC transporter permease [Longimicrobiales bacterium]